MGVGSKLLSFPSPVVACQDGRIELGRKGKYFILSSLTFVPSLPIHGELNKREDHCFWEQYMAESETMNSITPLDSLREESIGPLMSGLSLCSFLTYKTVRRRKCSWMNYSAIYAIVIPWFVWCFFWKRYTVYTVCIWRFKYLIPLTLFLNNCETTNANIGWF